VRDSFHTHKSFGIEYDECKCVFKLSLYEENEIHCKPSLSNSQNIKKFSKSVDSTPHDVCEKSYFKSHSLSNDTGSSERVKNIHKTSVKTFLSALHYFFLSLSLTHSKLRLFIRVEWWWLRDIFMT
jgi:hypothetical protein